MACNGWRETDFILKLIGAFWLLTIQGFIFVHFIDLFLTGAIISEVYYEHHCTVLR
jgi:hypothetical protein